VRGLDADVVHALALELGSGLDAGASVVHNVQYAGIRPGLGILDQSGGLAGAGAGDHACAIRMFNDRPLFVGEAQ